MYRVEGDAERRGKSVTLRDCAARWGAVTEYMITSSQLELLNALIACGNEHDFYLWSDWRRTRAQVLKMDHYECQACKEKGKYAKATIVHHVKHLKDRPDLALTIWDGDKRQLVSLCKSCHEAEHPESQRQFKNIRAPITCERWD